MDEVRIEEIAPTAPVDKRTKAIEGINTLFENAPVGSFVQDALRDLATFYEKKADAKREAGLNRAADMDLALLLKADLEGAKEVASVKRLIDDRKKSDPKYLEAYNSLDKHVLLLESHWAIKQPGNPEQPVLADLNTIINKAQIVPRNIPEKVLAKAA